MSALALSDTSKTELAQKLERARMAIKAHKQEAAKIAKLGIGLTLAAAGGAASGLLAVKHPKLFGSEIDTDAVVVLGLTGLVAAEAFDGAEEYVANFAMGMAGAVAARETQQFLASRPG